MLSKMFVFLQHAQLLVGHVFINGNNIFIYPIYLLQRITLYLYITSHYILHCRQLFTTNSVFSISHTF